MAKREFDEFYIKKAQLAVERYVQLMGIAPHISDVANETGMSFTKAKKYLTELQSRGSVEIMQIGRCLYVKPVKEVYPTVYKQHKRHDNKIVNTEVGEEIFGPIDFGNDSVYGGMLPKEIKWRVVSKHKHFVLAEDMKEPHVRRVFTFSDLMLMGKEKQCSEYEAMKLSRNNEGKMWRKRQ